MEYSGQQPPEPPDGRPPDEQQAPLDGRAKAALIGLAALAAGLGIALALILADPPTEEVVLTATETKTTTERPTTTTLTTSTLTNTTTTETTTDETVTETTTGPPETSTVTTTVTAP